MISAQSLLNEMNFGNLVMIDVRNVQEYEKFHIMSSINIPVSSLDNLVNNLDAFIADKLKLHEQKIWGMRKYRHVVLIEPHEEFYNLLMKEKKEIAFDNVSILDGGIESFRTKANNSSSISKLYFSLVIFGQ